MELIPQPVTEAIADDAIAKILAVAEATTGDSREQTHLTLCGILQLIRNLCEEIEGWDPRI